MNKDTQLNIQIFQPQLLQASKRRSSVKLEWRPIPSQPLIKRPITIVKGIWIWQHKFTHKFRHSNCNNLHSFLLKTNLQLIDSLGFGYKRDRILSISCHKHNRIGIYICMSCGYSLLFFLQWIYNFSTGESVNSSAKSQFIFGHNCPRAFTYNILNKTRVYKFHKF